MYGKESLEVIKNEILYKAYSSISEEEDELTQKSIAAFGIGTKILSSISLAGMKIDPSVAIDTNVSGIENKKLREGQQYISDGGVICLDDFERKSKNIDLNDLFGFISQLSTEMNCKVVIILNSEIFEGEEKNVFKTVKEKSVNKFFHFNPSINELFEVIFNDEKYEPLKLQKQ